jgi:hypothetical protein
MTVIKDSVTIGHGKHAVKGALFRDSVNEKQKRNDIRIIGIIFMHNSQNSTDDNITGGFLPHILFRGFYQQSAPRLKHNTLFTSRIKNYYFAVVLHDLLINKSYVWQWHYTWRLLGITNSRPGRCGRLAAFSEPSGRPLTPSVLLGSSPVAAPPMVALKFAGSILRVMN